MPGVLSGAIFAFIHSWDELVVVIFIGGRALFTLPRRMWDGINDNLDPVIAVVATGMILFTLLILTAELSLRARRRRARRPPDKKEATVGMIVIDEDDIKQFVERTEGKVYPRRMFMGMCGSDGPGADRAPVLNAGTGRSEGAGAGELGRRCREGHAARSGSIPISRSIPTGKQRIDGTGPRPAASA